jgi:hypothetical protein
MKMALVALLNTGSSWHIGAQVAMTFQSKQKHQITFHHVLDSLPVSGWQVIQEEAGLRVLLSGVLNGVNDSTLVDALTRNLAMQNIAVPRISVRLRHSALG